MFTWSKRLTVASLATLLIGCGGGGQSNSPGGGTEAVLGLVSLQMQGNAKPAISLTSANVAVTGLAGALFSKVQVNLPPANQTNIEYVRRHSRIAYAMDQVAYIYNYGGQTYRLVSPEANLNIHEVSFLGNGNKLVVEYHYGYASFGLATVNADGTDLRLTGVTSLYSFLGISGSPDGKFVAYNRYDDITKAYCIFTLNLTTGVETRITDGPDFSPEWTQGGRIVFYRTNYNTGKSRAFAMNADGAGQTDLNLGERSMTDISVSPSMKTIALLEYVSPTQYLVTTPFLGTGNYNSRPVGPYGGGYVSWAPDGNAVAYSQLTDSGWRLMLSPLGAGSENLLIPGVIDFDWSPYIDKWLMVGSSGILLKAAAGFLFSQSGQEVNSILAFDTATPSSAELTKLTEGGSGPNLVFDVHGDKVTALRYTNSLGGKPVVVVDAAKPTTHVTGAIVSFDSVSGQVVSVITYMGNQASPSVTRSNGQIVVDGDLVDAWDAKGELHPLMGVHRVAVDPVSGAPLHQN